MHVDKLTRCPLKKLTSWRRVVALVSAALGILFLSIAYLIYMRDASTPENLHAPARLRPAHPLALLWKASFCGSALLFIVSLFGLGWGRWLGLAANAAAFICALMTLGAMCGPFGC